MTGRNFTIYPITSNLDLFYKRINPIFFPRQGRDNVSTIGNLQLTISFATGETFEWNFYFVKPAPVCLLQTLIEQTRVWVAVSSSMKRGRKNHGSLAIYLSVRNVAPCLFLFFTTAFNVVCRWLYEKMTRTFRLQLYPFISFELVSYTRARYFQTVILDFYPRIFYTQEVIRERNCFSKCFPQCPRPPKWRTKAFRNIGRDILSRSLGCLNGKFFSRRVIQMAWRSLEVVGISCKALVNYCAAEYFTGNARNWRTRIFFLEKGRGCKCSYLNNRLSGFEAFTSIFRFNSTFSNFYLFQ